MRRIFIDNNTEKGIKRGYGMPWSCDAYCFNFKGPDELLLSSEVDTLRGCNDIMTLVIACPLEDYSFIEGMDKLRSLYIYDGSNITDLSFVNGLIGLRQLVIGDSKISDLAPLHELMEAKSRRADEIGRDGWRLGMDGICISSEYELPTAPIKGRSVCVGETIINGYSDVRAEKERRIKEKLDRAAKFRRDCEEL